MKICAIVLNYRDATSTCRCLSSLVGQGLDTVLVVDNSADAGAATDLDAVVQRLRESTIDFNLHITTPPNNLGFARGVNFGLATAYVQGCDAFLLINNDATAMPGMVEKLAEIIRQGRGDIALPAIRITDDKLQPMLRYHRFFGLMTTQRLAGTFAFPSGSCLMFRRELLKSGKLFDEDFFMYGEDVLLGWQVIQSKRDICLVPEAVAYHTGRASSGGNGLFYEYYTARAHVLLALKTWRNWLEIPLLLVAKCTGLFLRALWRVIHLRDLSPLLAVFICWIPLNISPDYGKRSD